MGALLTRVTEAVWTGLVADTLARIYGPTHNTKTQEPPYSFPGVTTELPSYVTPLLLPTRLAS